MNRKRILVVDNEQTWHGRLDGIFPPDAFETRFVANTGEALQALQQGPCELLIVDPMPPASRSDDPVARANHLQSELQGIGEIMRTYNSLLLIVASHALQDPTLQGAITVLGQIPTFDKNHFEQKSFETLVEHVFSGQYWGPPEPEITPAPDSMPEFSVVFPSTGLTGPLSSGLNPPAIEARHGHPRILIIEDRTEWQHTVAELMETAGYFWRVAPNYEEAMERLRLESFHIVVLDLQLEGPDVALRDGKGWQLLQYLVANCPNTKIVVSSDALSASDVAKLFMAYPIKGFIDKDSFSASEMLSIIREQLEGPLLRIQMLGDFRVWRDGKAINNFGHEKAETLIKILLTRRGENISVEELAEWVWPGADRKDAYGNLGPVVSSARTTLEPDLPRPSDSTFILRSGSNYRFNFLAKLDIDAEKLRGLVNEGRQFERRGQTDQALKFFEDARKTYLGDYLPGDRYATWAIQERSALQALYTEALNRMADLYAANGRLDDAIGAAQESLNVDAYLESTYRRLMRYQSCKGNRSAAMSVFRTLEKLFADFFDETPSEITKKLLDDIASGQQINCVETWSVSGEWRIATDH